MVADKVAGNLKGCVDAALEALNLATKASAAQVKTAVTGCGAKAKEEFMRAGGAVSETKGAFEKAQEKGAKNALSSAMKTCVDAATEALNLAAAPTDTQIATAVTGCRAAAKDTFAANGGKGTCRPPESPCYAPFLLRLCRFIRCIRRLLPDFGEI